jgi:single-strand DNA-binding protein
MGKSVNKVILLGNVGKDPDIRATAGGTMVANVSLATSARQKDSQGNWQDRTEWHNLCAFGRTAEIMRDYVRKGSKLYVEGKITTQSWDDKNTGEKRYRTQIVVFDIALLSGRENTAGEASKPSQQAEHHGGGSRNSRAVDEERWQNETEIDDDDIPF